MWAGHLCQQARTQDQGSQSTNKKEQTVNWTDQGSEEVPKENLWKAEIENRKGQIKLNANKVWIGNWTIAIWKTQAPRCY